MKTNLVVWLIAAATLARVVSVQAAPWLGLVKSGTTSQTSDTIAFGTLTFSMDLRANTDGHATYALQFSIATTPGNVVTYGTTPLTALNSPFVAADLTGLGQSPGAGSAVNDSNWTVWWHSAGDYAAFPEQSIGTFQFNVGSLGAGSYVFSLGNQELLNDNPGEDLTNADFAMPGSFTLNVMAVPEPNSIFLVAVGGCVLQIWRRGHSRVRRV
jgi:hypothetical protein